MVTNSAKVVPDHYCLEGGVERLPAPYKFRSNSGLRLTGDLRQMLPGVIAYGIQFDLNLYFWDTAGESR